MNISPKLGRVIVAFWEAQLPVDGPDGRYRRVRDELPQRMSEYFEPQRFDDPALAKAVPWIFRILQLAPILFFWLTWRPLPLTWLSIAGRQRFLRRMEASRIYAVRGLYMVAKIYAGMFFFADPDTWDLVGYDGKGELPPTVNPKPHLDAIRGDAAEAAASGGEG